MKINKTNDYNVVIIAAFLVIAIIANTVNLVISNVTLSNKVKAYEDYYKSSEALFDEIEDYNENLFDTDRAVEYYEAKDKISSRFK